MINRRNATIYQLVVDEPFSFLQRAKHKATNKKKEIIITISLLIVLEKEKKSLHYGQ
jgi:predicted branched-subunit amino acid permease